MTDHGTDPTTTLLERLADTFPDQPAPVPALVAAAHEGQRRRRRRDAVLVVAVLVLGLGGGIATERLRPGDGADRTLDRIADTTPPCDRGNPVPPSEPIPSGPDYPTNAAGQTYGAAIDGSPQPDLVGAIGDCGRSGYVERDRLEEPPPWEPGAGNTGPQPFPVYESDGTTQIDTYTRDGSDPPSAPTDGPDAADLRGRWTATIAGISRGGEDAYDTYRDLDLWIVFDDHGLVQVHDGCQTVQAGVEVRGGAFALTSPFDIVLGGSDPGCERSAPFPQVVENVRYVTSSRGQTHLHLENFRIAVVLKRQG